MQIFITIFVPEYENSDIPVKSFVWMHTRTFRRVAYTKMNLCFSFIFVVRRDGSCSERQLALLSVAMAAYDS